MRRLAILFAVVVLPGLALPAQADGIFGLFGKKAKSNPAQRIPELVSTIKTNTDERKRSNAAMELGTQDGAAHPEAVAVLVDALQNDPKPGVRIDAATSLAQIRPVTQFAGQALERSAANDDNWRVRWHAKSVLVKYRLAGFSGQGDAKPIRSEEPPLIDPTTPAPAKFPTGNASKPSTPLSAKPVPSKIQPKTNVAKTPLTAPAPVQVPVDAKKIEETSPEFRPAVPRTLPKGPTFSTAVPQQPTRVNPAPLPMVEEGPVLTPPPPTKKSPF